MIGILILIGQLVRRNPISMSKIESKIISKHGFTLVEISVAIAILGVALVIFVSLQAKLINSFIYEKNLFRATLAAQYMMTFIEVSKTAPEIYESQSDLVEVLTEKGYFLQSGINDAEKQFTGWTFNQKVSGVEDLGNTPLEDAIRKVEIKVNWSDSEKDSVTLTYFAYNSK